MQHLHPAGNDNKMATKNNSPERNYLKEKLVENEQNIPPPNLQQAAQVKELHPVHSFQWRWSNQGPTTVTCNEAGTVEDSLKKSAQFKELVKKYKDKELVIMRDGRALSPHFPCVLLKNKECLTVKFVKAVDKPKKLSKASGIRSRKKTICELVTFHVLAKGGKNIVKILENPALKQIHEITVYAYKGERVKQALRRDGRFNKAIFKKNCAFSHRSTEVKTEMSSLVDDLDGETFQIILLNRSNPPESQPGSLDDAYVVANEIESQHESENGSTQKNEPELNTNIEPEKILQEIPCSKKTQDHLSSQFTHCVENLKPQAYRLSRIQNLLRVEFGQNTQMCREVKTMKKLMDLSSSVCQVRVNGRPRGSGFLLFGRCVLTNGHVIQDNYNENRKQLDGKVTVHFSYESIEQVDGGFDVEEVVCFDYCPDMSGRDWALLRLSADETLPVGLLKHFGFLPQHGGICIIGHPEGGVKKIDPCLIVPFLNRNMVVERHYSENQGHVQLVTPSFFQNVARSVEQNKPLTYESCFFFGSSGSPVFDVDCKVVAVHTGGYVYPGRKGENLSVIEFGQPLADIMVHLIIQLVERKRLDVVKEYLACSYTHHQIIMDGVKHLVESRNIRAFKTEVSSLVSTDDVTLKFFEFFSLKDKPIPMEID